MKRKSKRRLQGDVEIQITPMLDMAFQLLTFFIMTYNPTPVEGQLSLDLLPDRPQTQSAASSSTPSNDLPAELRTLPTLLRADASGKLAAITLGEAEINSIENFRAELKQIAADPNLAFDQAVLQVDPNLHYAEMIRVVDEFLAGGIKKISFAEIPPTP